MDDICISYIYALVGQKGEGRVEQRIDWSGGGCVPGLLFTLMAQFFVQEVEHSLDGFEISAC